MFDYVKSFWKEFHGCILFFVVGIAISYFVSAFGYLGFDGLVSIGVVAVVVLTILYLIGQTIYEWIVKRNK